MHPRNVGHSGNVQSGRRRDEQWGVRGLSKGRLYLQLVVATPIGSAGVIQWLFHWTLVLWWSRNLVKTPLRCRSGISQGFCRTGGFLCSTHKGMETAKKFIWAWPQARCLMLLKQPHAGGQNLSLCIESRLEACLLTSSVQVSELIFLGTKCAEEWMKQLIFRKVDWARVRHTLALLISDAAKLKSEPVLFV